MYKNRIEAGKRLTTALWSFRDQKNTVVVAIPRGGIIIGHTIARTLNLDLELVMVKKLGHPLDSEYSIGTVSLNDYYVKEGTEVDPEYISQEVKKTQKYLQERYEMYYEDRVPLNLNNKTIILVDDGVSSGSTLISAITMLRKAKPKRIVVAVPVGPAEIIKKLNPLVEKVICLEIHDPFYSIRQYYQEFDEVSDMEIKELLEKKYPIANH